MKTMKQKIVDLRTDWIGGRWTPDNGEEPWGGAGLIVTDKPRKDSAVVVATKYAGEVSSLVTELRDRLNDYLDYFNKYAFYPRLGEAANRCIAENGDVLVCIISEILGEAGDIADEWYPTDEDGKEA